MNKNDLNNLAFIMSLRTDQELLAFLESCSCDDFEYAIALLKTAQADADVTLMEMDEAEQDDEGLDCSQALEIINRVKKGVSK